MKLKTVQASAFKSTFEVLKDILNDVNIYFTPEGVKVTTLDTARAALVDLFLEADKFEEYQVDETNHVAGVNVVNMYKLLKSINTNDCLEIEINDREFMNIKFENDVKKSKTEFRLKLLDINEDIIEVPSVDMNVVTTMNSGDLQKICRDMSNIGEDVVICRNKHIFSIKCMGDFAEQKTEIECTDEDFNGRVEGTYSLKYINLFTKATNMCSLVQVMQENSNRFLILKYNIASLGEVKFYIATKVTE